MPLMSRFLKDKKGDEDPLDDMQEAEEEDEGLFMPTKLRPGGGEQDQDPAAQGGGGGIDELLEASSAENPLGEAAEPSTEGDADPAEAGEDVEGDGPAVQTVSAGGEGSDQSGDDPLSLFRSSAAESSAGNLTKDIEDVPVEELLAELRELRAMLVSNQTSADNGSE